MQYKAIRVDTRGHLARIKLNRPRSGNPVDSLLADELGDACPTLNQDDRVHAVILSAAPGPFSLGSTPQASIVPGDNPGSRACQAMAWLNVPVIAAISGDALGAGLELAMSCDILVASTKANFGFPQVLNGIMPSAGGTQRLPRLVGRGKATELLLLGTTIDAWEALRIGLVNETVTPVRLGARVNELARTILSRGPIAVCYAKEAVAKGMDMTLAQGLRLETDLNIILQTTFDRAEGVSAFMEKRKARFKGV